MKQIQKRRTRRLAVLTGALLMGSLFYAVPAYAVACTANTANPTFVMSAGELVGCPTDTDVVTVTGGGTSTGETVTFNLSGGEFDGIKFELNLTGTENNLVVNGSADKDNVDMGSLGVNLDGSGAVEVVAAATASATFEEQFKSYTIKGGGQADVLGADGRSGTNNAMSDAVILQGEAGPDFLFGGAGDDTLGGGDGDDVLNGGAGVDAMEGGIGKDTFSMGTVPDGADTVTGGADVDTVDYSRRTTSVSVTLDSTANDGAADYTAPANGWPLPDADTTDAITPVAPTWTSTETDNVGSDVEILLGGEGNDELDASSSTSNLTKIDGDEGHDVITGGSGKDNLFGWHGNDVIFGGDSKDRIMGGTGDDVEFGEAGNDVFVQERTANGADYMDGGGDQDIVNYGSRSNTVMVTLGDGDVNSFTGNDGEVGESDNFINVEKAKGGGDDDTLEGGGVDSVLIGKGGDDSLTGGSGKDRLRGGPGDDTLNGGGDNDKLYGQGGNDVLNGGGGGNDFGHGGPGTDKCTALARQRSCEL